MEVDLEGTGIPAKIRHMTREEADIAIRWASEEGWNPGLHDADAFYRAGPEGFFAVIADGRMVGSVSLLRYNDDFMFGGLYIIHPDYRGRGLGRAVLGFARDYSSSCNFGIDGVYEMQAVYEKAGFRFAYRNIRYEGVCNGEADNSLIPLRNVPFPRILAYDSECFPAVREKFLKHFIYQRDSTGYAAIDRDTLTGYGYIRKCQKGYKIGPLFADTPEIARKIYLALGSYAPGEPLFLDVPEPNNAGIELALSHEMKEVFGTARMYTREIPKLPLNRIFGVTSFELG